MLFNNNKQEHYDNKGNNYEGNIYNELEVFLFLLIDCASCQEYKELSDEEIRLKLEIPGNIKVTKVFGGDNNVNYYLFKRFGINNVPAVVINHRVTGLYEISDVSKEAIALTASKVVDKVRAAIAVL